MNLSNIINKNKHKIGDFISFLLCLSLFRELKTKQNTFLEYLNLLGEFSLYICIISLVFYSLFFIQKKKFFLYISSFLIVYFLILFLLKIDFEFNYVLKRIVQIIILCLIFSSSFLTNFNLNYKIIMKYLLFYLFFLLLLLLYFDSSLFESISRINVISFFAIIVLSYELFFKKKINYFLFSIISLILIFFGSRFFIFFILLAILLKFFCSFKHNISKNIWFLFVILILSYYVTLTLQPAKILDTINVIVSKVLKLDEKTFVYASENKTVKFNIIKYEEDKNKLKRNIKKQIYFDPYIGLLSRVILNQVYIDQMILNPKREINNKISILLQTYSLNLSKSVNLNSHPNIDYRLGNLKPLLFIQMNKILNKHGLEKLIDFCATENIGLTKCFNNFVKDNFDKIYNLETFKNFEINNVKFNDLGMEIFDNLSINFYGGTKGNYFSSHNSFLGFIHAFSFAGILFTILSIIFISKIIYKNKISSDKILMMIFLLSIHQFEDYLFSNAFQVSIISFIIFGKILSSKQLIYE